jgi:hypothetical protein
MLRNVTFSDAGVVPHIDPSLFTKPKSKKKAQ